MALKQTRSLVALMVSAVALVAALAWWDEQRESSAALDDFAQEQATLAASVASNLQIRLRHLPANGAPPSNGAALTELLSGVDLPEVGRVERPNEVIVLVRAPGMRALYTSDRRLVESAPLRDALDRGAATVRLTRPEAAALGLPERTAIGGLAGIDAGLLGHWNVAVVASALHVRDRQRRAGMRLVLAVVIAGGLVLAFGGLALRTQRSTLQLSHRLALTELARQRDERLERLSQAATMLTLASGMAHELGTPLGVIVGRAEQLALKVTGDERATRSVQSILEQAEHIREVVRGFLGLARGGMPVLREVEPLAVVTGAATLVEHRFTKAGVKLVTHVSDGTPQIRCEPRLLEHALVNLLLNACDACSSGGQVRVEVGSTTRTVEFAVTDNGSGIDVELAARVAEPFFTTKPMGTGLGLAVTNEIVKTHRGTLTFAPVEPNGTRVAFQVPVAAEQPALRSDASSTSAQTGGQHARL
jgi:signal transduction histidine kinase